jgi:ABC-2 type transport system ATP-binding protein/lipopolysaccharide transport system ATP-binding protein
MAYIKLNNLTLDYIIKPANMSLKKTVLQGVKKMPFVAGKPSHTKPYLYRALDGLDLEINDGDRVGLIGRNGSGKSTLLRTLAGVYSPTFGGMDVDGTISTLLEINLGLFDEATGYENIIMLGIARGKTKKEMIAKFADLEEFTELGEHLNAPVRTYSSGMRLRLIFGVVTTLHADILLIDEVIGVGDAFFVEKAIKRIGSMVDKSKILVLASHSDDLIMQFCNKVLFLDKGKALFYGDTKQGIEYYYDYNEKNK